MSDLWRNAERHLEAARDLERNFQQGTESPLYPSALEIISAVRAVGHFKAELDLMELRVQGPPRPGNSYWLKVGAEVERQNQEAHHRAVLHAYALAEQARQTVQRVVAAYCEQGTEPPEAA